MSWAIGYDSQWDRFVGYGVPCECDYPGCTTVIDRGLSYVCGQEPYGGERGCGLFFCNEHMRYSPKFGNLCPKCYPRIRLPYKPKDDIIEWKWHMYTDSSWKQWREENSAKVSEIRDALVKRFNEDIIALLDRRIT